MYAVPEADFRYGTGDVTPVPLGGSTPAGRRTRETPTTATQGALAPKSKAQESQWDFRYGPGSVSPKPLGGP